MSRVVARGGIAYAHGTVVVVVAATCDASRAVVMMVAIVTTVPAVAHARMMLAGNRGAVVMTMVLVVAVSTVHAPAVTATIGNVEVRTSEVEVVTMRIAGIDAEVPIASAPVERTVEIGGGAESFPLPGVEDVLQVDVATVPVGAEHVVTAGYTHQIVEVNLIGCLVLCISKIKLVGHLVGQEQRLVASLFVTHGFARHC